jgi:NADH:ubiquinone oxidoreductase subunit F (NADH-binding)
VDEIYEQVVNIILCFCRCLKEFTAKISCQSCTFPCRDLPVDFPVTLISDEHEDGMLSCDTDHGLTKILKAIE